MRVGIITWHYYPNFGSSLQAFALQEAVKSLGVDVTIINYRNPKINHTSVYKDYLRFILSVTLGSFFKRFRYAHLQFMFKYLNQTRPFFSEQDLAKHVDGFDLIICGSDQIWAPNVFNTIYFASFFKGKKVSYAASVGLSSIPKVLIPEYREQLKRFTHISVREEEGQRLLKTVCNVDSEVVLDPTLLLPIDRYKSMERPVRGLKKPFMFCYFLNVNHEYKKCVLDYAKRTELRVVGVSANKSDSSWMELYGDLSACEFLWLINHAQFVLTDSYHGTIFSLLYHKNFRTFLRFAESDPIAQNSRIRQLNSFFGIERIIQDQDQGIGSIKFDYSVFDKDLNDLRMKSLSYLKCALEC